MAKRRSREMKMHQTGMDPTLSEAYEFLDELGPDKYSGFSEVPWERFRSRLEGAWRKPASERKAASGQPPWDAVMMFKALVMGRLNNLSDERLALALRSDLLLMRFIGVNANTGAPSAKTLWKYRDELGEAIEGLFAEFNEHLAEAGLVATEGHIVDSTTVKAPVQRNSRDENRTIKGGGTPEGWKDNPAKLRQKDLDARWFRKNGLDIYGFKFHTLVDAGCKLIRYAEVTAASVHDSQVMGSLIEGAGENESPLVYGDSAYSSKEIEEMLSRKDLVSMINRKGCRHKKLSEADKLRNKLNSRTRVRAEHVYASLVNEIGGKQVRGVGLRRARVDLFLKALAYNMKQAAYLLANRRPEAAAA